MSEQLADWQSRALQDGVHPSVATIRLYLRDFPDMSALAAQAIISKWRVDYNSRKATEAGAPYQESEAPSFSQVIDDLAKKICERVWYDEGKDISPEETILYVKELLVTNWNYSGAARG